jgi:molybdopterin converting factor small subunit
MTFLKTVVKVRLYGILRALGRIDTVEVEASEVLEACRKAINTLGYEVSKLVFDNEGKIYPSILIFKNSRLIKDLTENVNNDDILHIIPPIEGG